MFGNMLDHTIRLSVAIVTSVFRRLQKCLLNFNVSDISLMFSY